MTTWQGGRTGGRAARSWASAGSSHIFCGSEYPRKEKTDKKKKQQCKNVYFGRAEKAKSRGVAVYILHLLAKRKKKEGKNESHVPIPHVAPDVVCTVFYAFSLSSVYGDLPRIDFGTHLSLARHFLTRCSRLAIGINRPPI